MIAVRENSHRRVSVIIRRFLSLGTYPHRNSLAAVGNFFVLVSGRACALEAYFDTISVNYGSSFIAAYIGGGIFKTVFGYNSAN